MQEKKGGRPITWGHGNHTEIKEWVRQLQLFPFQWRLSRKNKKQKQNTKQPAGVFIGCFYSTFRVKIYCLSLTQRKGALLICTKHYYVSISRFKGHPRDSKGRKQDGLSDSWCFSESSEAEVIITGRCGRRIKKFNYGRDRERRQLFREVLFLKSRRLRIYFCYNVMELRRHGVGIQQHHVGILRFTHRGDVVTETEENQDKLAMCAR